MRKAILEAMGRFFKGLPVDYFTTDHTQLAFISLTIGTAIYGYLMLADEVDDWKKVAVGAAGWLLMLILGIFLAAEEFGRINEGETSSRLFVLELLALSVAYTVISLGASFVRESCLVHCISILIMLLGILAGTGYVVILIRY